MQAAKEPWKLIDFTTGQIQELEEETRFRFYDSDTGQESAPALGRTTQHSTTFVNNRVRCTQYKETERKGKPVDASRNSEEKKLNIKKL